jgi:hypothetical protein
MIVKKLILLVFLLLSIPVNAQRIGNTIAEKPAEEFPNNSYGLDLLFGEGGFGLGTFYRYNFAGAFTGFADFSVSESKDQREFEYIDYWGQSIVIGKKNRVLTLPLNFGIQYRLFKDEITDNLRPYVSAAIGPDLVITTPYEMEFFTSFKKATTKIALGGYVGLGADFGLSKSNLVGINFRYSFAKLFDKGVENLQGKFRKNLSSFYVILNIGLMF